MPNVNVLLEYHTVHGTVIPENLVYVCWPSNNEFFTFMLTYLLIHDIVYT